MKLVTERLSLQSITVEDWPLFCACTKIRGDPLHLRSAQRSEIRTSSRAAAGLGQTRRAVAVPGDA